MMPKFFNRYFSLPRIKISKRPRYQVNSQISLVVNDDKKQDVIIKGWNYVASCLGVDPERLRLDDTMKDLSLLDWTGGEKLFELHQIIKKTVSSSLPNEVTLIELAYLVGRGLQSKR